MYREECVFRKSSSPTVKCDFQHSGKAQQQLIQSQGCPPSPDYESKILLDGEHVQYCVPGCTAV